MVGATIQNHATVSSHAAITPSKTLSNKRKGFRATKRSVEELTNHALEPMQSARSGEPVRQLCVMVVTVVRRMVENVCCRFEHRHHRFEVERFAFSWAAMPRCEVGSNFDLTARAVGVNDGDPFAHFDFTDELEPCVFGEHSETVLREGWYDDEVTCFDVHVGAVDVETDRSGEYLEDLVAAVAVQSCAGAG